MCVVYRHASGHPVNALTLEEVHKRENIAQSPRSPSSSHSDAADQSAFNRLVAVLQSSGAIHDEPSQVCVCVLWCLCTVCVCLSVWT